MKANLITLPNKITEYKDKEIFIKQYRKVFNSKEALVKSVVYTFTTEHEIPRANGHSNIFYIGKTKNSLRIRYFKYAETFTMGRNWINFPNIIRLYGPISINYSVHDESALIEIEQKLLNDYFNVHFEYPPHNHARS